MRVLIIDDGQTGDDLSHHLKTIYGAETFRSKTLVEGLRMRTEIESLDFVVFDLSFPDSTPDESIKCIPRLSANDVQVFVFTGYEEKDLLEKSLDAGAVDWFLKGSNHRGGSALAVRMASSFYRTRNMSGPAKARIGSSILAARKEQAEAVPLAQVPKVSWFATGNAVVTLGILLVLQLIALCGFMYSQGGANALFRNRVEIMSLDVTSLKAESSELHDKTNESKQNQRNIESRLGSLDTRITDADKRYDEFRKDMNAGFQKIYDILLQDRKTNSDNRQMDQHNNGKR